MKALYQGKDFFVWLPTGYGKIKSLCYQPTSPVLIDYKRGRINVPETDLSVVIVVSPLMVDQVSSLQSISAAILSGNSETSRLAGILSL